MIRVLVVDDHPVLRAGLEAVLRGEPGFVCVGTAADGAGLRRALGHARPDVVVLDRRLGLEDGIELCRDVRARDGAPAVVIYTAQDTAEVRAEARAAGAHGVVEKTDRIDLLFDTIRLAARAAGRTAEPQ